ncbi:hypothetical protein HFD88_009051 [Aspergillus terreus]|nr:hypothetical protein HFD88_009051 [Aspergillus terreus]
MRLLACNSLKVENNPDKEQLANMQQEDGGWEPSAMYLFPTDKKEVGNRGRACQNGLSGGDRRRIAEITVELIEALWSTMDPAARNNPSSTSNARLNHDLSELLRPATGDNEEPHRAQFAKSLQVHVADDSSGRSDDGTTDNDKAVGGDQDGTSPRGQGVLEPGSMGL